MLDGDLSPLLHGERLLIGAIRRLALHSGCAGAQAHFEQVCGWAGAEACRMLEVFLQQIAAHGRRRLVIGVPTDPRLTDDERTILEAFGCAQVEAYEAMDERLGVLLHAMPPAALGAAACIVAQTLAINGCLLDASVENSAQAQCWEARTTPSSTAAQWAPAAATTWPCQMARANFRRLFT